MGKYGSAILTIGGTLIGSLVGFPALGAVLGGLAGQLLFPAQLPKVQGPRLADIAATNSTVGASVPRGWGFWPSSGFVLYESDLREVVEKEEVGGKGAPGQTVEKTVYYQDIAIAVNGSDIFERGVIGGIRTIWANGKTIYDRRPQRTDEDAQTFEKRMTASTVLESAMTIYLGTEDQLPDPTIEALEGVGNISAFRGIAYVVFRNWKNKDEDGQRAPQQWRFECFTAASQALGDDTEYSNEVLYDWKEGGPPVDERNVNIYTAVGATFYSIASPPVPSDTPTLAEVVHLAGNQIPWPDLIYAGAVNIIEPVQAPDSLGGTPFSDQRGYQAVLHYLPVAPQYFPRYLGYGACDVVDSAGVANPFTSPGALAFTPAYGGTQTLAIPGAEDDPIPVPPYDFWPAASRCASDGMYWFNYSGSVTVEVTRTPGAPENPCAAGTSIDALIPGYCISRNNALERIGTDWIFDDTQNYYVLQVFDPHDATVDPEGYTMYPLSPARPVSHPDNTEEFWTAAYTKARIAGLIREDRVYNAGGSGDLHSTYPIIQGFGYYRTFTNSTYEGPLVSQATIVRDLCEEAGYNVDTDIDVGDLIPITHVGFVRPRVMPARAALEQLRTVGFWDTVESGGRIKFVRRGGPIVKTLTEAELGARLDGEEQGSIVTTRKILEFDLPRKLRLHYLDPARDYDPGEQASPNRIETTADQEIDIEVAVCLSPDQAAQICEIIHADAWLSRWMHEIAVDTSNFGLEPTDVIGIPVDARIERVRIQNATASGSMVKKFEACRDDDGTYVSTAVGSIAPYIPTTPSLAGPGELILMDLPALREIDNDAGVYAAMRPYFNEANLGIGVYRSVDRGGTFQRVGQVAGGGTIGVVKQRLEEGPHTVWDEKNTLIVFMDCGTPESKTRLQVQGGSNAAAVGADGRWEIIQYCNAVNIIDNVWAFSVLLRGRRGTEHFIGTGQQDDRFIVLSNAGTNIARIALGVSSVGREYLYKGVMSGAPIAAVESFAFTGRGVALKPFSPCMVTAVFNTSTNGWEVSWIRRGRLGETMRSGVDIALSEDFEDYEVDILTPGNIVARTISSSVENVTYSGLQQVNDFGALQTTLRFTIYQLSVQVGRGTGTYAEATIA